MVTAVASPLIFSSSPRALRRLADCLAPRNASLRLLLVLLSISSPVSPLRYGLVGTVAGDGAPRSLSDFRSSGVCWTPFSFSHSSLVGLPFSLPLFDFPARSVRSFCGSSLSLATGWASTSIDNV